MRLRMVALAIALNLGLAGFAAADDSSSWWPRWMAPWSGANGKSAKTDAGKSLDDDEPKKPLVTDAARRKQAKIDLERRQEVLLKLREIATSANDEDTLKRIEELENRVWDLYVAVTQMRVDTPRAAVEPERAEGGGVNAQGHCCRARGEPVPVRRLLHRAAAPALVGADAEADRHARAAAGPAG